MNKSIEKYMPLSEATTCILIALIEPLHGYGIMQKVEAFSTGAIQLGPGTLYGVLASLEKEKLIRMVREEERRKVYRLTPAGLSLLRAQIARLDGLARAGQAALNRVKD